MNRRQTIGWCLPGTTTRLPHRCLLLLAITACAPGGDTAEDTAASATTVPAAGPATGAAHAHGVADGEGLPLLPIMQQLGGHMLGVTQALFTDDHAMLTVQAGAIAEHAPISQAEVARIQSILGSDMHTFEELDAAVHDASMQLHQAAEARDINAVLTHLAAVQRGCVACHQQFRERLGSPAPVQ